METRLLDGVLEEPYGVLHPGLGHVTGPDLVQGVLGLLQVHNGERGGGEDQAHQQGGGRDDAHQGAPPLFLSTIFHEFHPFPESPVVF